VDRAFLNCIPGGGQRRRFHCPLCYAGGKSERNTMVIIDSSRADCIILYCHRGSCPSHELSKTGGGIKLETYLRHYRPEIYDDYRAALRAEARGDVPDLPPAPLPRVAPRAHESAAAPETLRAFIRSELPSAFSLPEDHAARQYVEERKLPRHHSDLVLWDEAFDHTASLMDGQGRRPDARLVIHYVDSTGQKLTAILGRSITPGAGPKYMAAKCDPDAPLIFGLERVQPSGNVLVLEGPLDSLFLNAAIAVTGTNLTTAVNVLPKERLILVYDNQVKVGDRMIRAAQDGFRVAVWWLQGGAGRKDINDLVLAGHAPEKLLALLTEHTFTGTEAVRRIRRWRDL